MWLDFIFRILPRKGIDYLYQLAVTQTQGGFKHTNKMWLQECSLHEPEVGAPHGWLVQPVSHLIFRTLWSRGNWRMLLRRKEPIPVRIVFWKTKDCPPVYSPLGSLPPASKRRRVEKSIAADLWVSSVQFSCSAVSDFLWPHGQQHARPPCPSGEFTQTHVHHISDAIQPSHPLSSPSPPIFNLSQHQCLFQWVSSSHQVAKILEFQLQHQSFKWVFRTDFL